MIILSEQEQARLQVLNAVDRGTLRMAKAAQLLGLSVRQVRRLRRGYHAPGARALLTAIADAPPPDVSPSHSAADPPLR